MRSEGRLNAVIILAVLAAIGALAVFALPAVLNDWQRDLGYSDEELEDVERLCEAELEDFEGEESYDARFDRCEEDEKFRINPDPFGVVLGANLTR